MNALLRVNGVSEHAALTYYVSQAWPEVVQRTINQVFQQIFKKVTPQRAQDMLRTGLREFNAS